MPQFVGRPQKPTYPSVEAYLEVLAEDVGILLDTNPSAMKPFRDHLRQYNRTWTDWTTAKEARRQKCWEPSMGQPDHPLNVFRWDYNINPYDNDKERKVLSGSYSLLAFIHDRKLSHLKKINKGIVVSSEAIEQTLAAPGNMIDGGHINRKSRMLAEMTLIEEHYNRVQVDIQEYVASCAVESEAEKARKAKELDRLTKLPDVELFEYVAGIFRKRELKVLAKDETWLSLDRSLKPGFEIAIERLKQAGKTSEIELLQYHYGRFLHYARNINIKSFRGFRDWKLVKLAGKQATELAKKFEDVAASPREAKQESKPIAESAEEEQQQQPGRKDRQPRNKTRRKRKAPPELLKEARERKAVKELASNPNMTCIELAKILECDKSTVVRLKAWKNKGVLDYKPPKGIVTRQEDDSYTVDGIARTEPEDQ